MSIDIFFFRKFFSFYNFLFLLNGNVADGTSVLFVLSVIHHGDGEHIAVVIFEHWCVEIAPLQDLADG